MIKIIDNGKLKTSELMAQLKKKFNVYLYWDDKELDENFLKPKKSTTRCFNESQEPDNETLGKNFGELQKMNGITLREYILLFMKYHEKTGKYLDEKGWTIFSDSLSGGGVARGYWRPGNRGVLFDWDDSSNADPSRGARLAIPSNLKPESLESRIEKLEEFQKKVSKFLILE